MARLIELRICLVPNGHEIIGLFQPSWWMSWLYNDWWEVWSTVHDFKSFKSFAPPRCNYATPNFYHTLEEANKEIDEIIKLNYEENRWLSNLRHSGMRRGAADGSEPGKRKAT